VIEKAIHNILSNAPDITDVVGNRIYITDTQPQGPVEDARLVLSYDKTYSHTLASVSDLEQANIQVACLATTKLASLELAEVVRSVLDDYSGTVEGKNIRGIMIQSASSITNLQPEEKATVFGVEVNYVAFYK
jgi:hypothetical protein